MTFFINPKAGGGTALTKWNSLAPNLHTNGKALDLCFLNGFPVLRDRILHAIESGETDFIAAGGDGTVNTVLNTLLTAVHPEELHRIRFGAIGLGSSNDFHKPVMREQVVERIPCKTDFDHARLRDVGRVQYDDGDTPRMKYFLINASVGLTAEANRFFNNPDAVLSLLKRVHTGTAILDAALKTIFSYRNIRVTLRSDDESVFSSNLTNLGVVKNPHFSGNLSYGGPAAYDDGLLNIHLCHDMSRFEILRLLKALGVGRFSSIPKTRSWTTDAVEVTSEHAFAVEFDGEIVSTKHAKFSVLKKHLKVCQ